MTAQHDWRTRSLGPFPSGDLLLLWSGRLISQLGDRTYGIALAWWVLQKTGSASAMGLVMALSLLPEIVVGLFAGPFIDRWDRRTILVVTDLLRGLAVLGVTALQASGALTVGGVAVAAVSISLASAFFNPASQAIIPQVVPESGLSRANSLHQMTNGLTMVAGPLLGAVAVGALGFTWAFAGNALSFFASGLLESGLSPPGPRAGAGSASLLEELREGLVFLWTRKPLLAVIAVIGVAHFFWGSFMVGLPLLAKELTGDGVRNLGMLQTAIGVGLVVGAAAAGVGTGQVPGEKGLFTRVALFGVVFLSVAGLLGLPVRATPPYVVAMVVYGGTVAGASVLWQSLLQWQTPTALAGRVFSVSSLVGDVSVPLAYAFFGVVLETQAVGLVLLIDGIALLAIGTTLRLRWRQLAPGAGGAPLWIAPPREQDRR
jgi:DHA3 family macrolide efflux protein-like MFS transporter